MELDITTKGITELLVIITDVSGEKNSETVSGKHMAHVHQGLDSLRPSDAYICVCELTIICSHNGFSPCTMDNDNKLITFDKASMLDPFGPLTLSAID